MTEKLKSLGQFFDTTAEVVAWLVLVLACIAFFGFDVDDFVFGGLVLSALALMGYVERVKAGPIEFGRKAEEADDEPE